jgi:hypothetical protein
MTRERNIWRMASQEIKFVEQEIGARDDGVVDLRTNEKWICPALLCGNSIPHSHYWASKSRDFDLFATGASHDLFATFISLFDFETSIGIPVTVRLQNIFDYPLNGRVPFRSTIFLANESFNRSEWNISAHLETQSVALLIENLQQDSILSYYSVLFHPTKTNSMVSKITACTAPLTALSGKKFPQLGRITFETATTTVAVFVLLVVCLLCVLIWNQTRSISELLTGQRYWHTQSSAEAVKVPLGKRMPNKKWKRRRRARRRIWNHRLARLSLTLISLLATGASSQLLKGPTVPSNASPLHSSRALTGTLGV